MGTLELVEAINCAQVLRSRVFGGIAAGHLQQGLGVLGFKVYLLVVIAGNGRLDHHCMIVQTTRPSLSSVSETAYPKTSTPRTSKLWV